MLVFHGGFMLFMLSLCALAFWISTDRVQPRPLDTYTGNPAADGIAGAKDDDYMRTRMGCQLFGTLCDECDTEAQVRLGFRWLLLARTQMQGKGRPQ